MPSHGIFSILILALAPLVLIAIIQIVKQSSQQKILFESRASLTAKREKIPANAENAFFSENMPMVENVSKLKQHNEGQSPYSIRWPSFKVRDFSANCKMTTTERGLR